MNRTNWQLQTAKARLSELVKSVQREGPQYITVHGKPAAVVLSSADYELLAKERLPFVEFMRQSPLKGATLMVIRDKSTIRDIQL